MKNQISIIEGDLQHISDMLLLNGTLTECPGLVHGKMGIAVFFFHYTQYTGNMLFADYAMDVIAEMLNQLNVNSPADYEKGVAGIGVGLDYLIQNNYLDAEDDICEDFDQRMVRAVMHDPWLNFSQYNGLIGYGRYWMTRFYNQISALQARECLLYITKLIEKQLSGIPIGEQADVLCFLVDLQKILGFIDCTELLAQCRRTWNLQSLDITRRFPQLGDFKALDLEKAPTSMSLLSGYAGEGMLRLTALGQTNKSWVKLL